MRERIHDALHSTQWGANLIGWWSTHVENHRSRKDLIEYHKEADDKVWLMRSFPCDNPEIEKDRLAAVERIMNTYNDIPEEGYNFVYTSRFITKTEDEEYEEITKRLTFVVTKVEDRRIIEAKLFIEVIEDEDEDEAEKDE